MRVISLDRQKVLEELQQAAERLIHQRPDVLAVVLFGSLVEGTASGTSDADVLVILRSSSTRFLDRIPNLLEAFRGLSLPVDLFPYTLEELKCQLAQQVGTGRTALLHGRLLAGELPFPQKVLIYDGQCAYCRGFAGLVRALDRRRRFALLPFESEDAHKLLRAQFGEDFGFAMFLFEEESVSWGSEAAKRVVQALSLPGAAVVFWLYPKIVQIVSWLTRRERRVCGPGCLHQSQQSSMQAPLKPELRELLVSL